MTIKPTLLSKLLLLRKNKEGFSTVFASSQKDSLSLSLSWAKAAIFPFICPDVSQEREGAFLIYTPLCLDLCCKAKERREKKKKRGVCKKKVSCSFLSGPSFFCRESVLALGSGKMKTREWERDLSSCLDFLVLYAWLSFLMRVSSLLRLMWLRAWRK